MAVAHLGAVDRLTEPPPAGVGVKAGEVPSLPRGNGRNNEIALLSGQRWLDSGVMVRAFHSLPADHTIDFHNVNPCTRPIHMTTQQKIPDSLFPKRAVAKGRLTQVPTHG